MRVLIQSPRSSAETWDWGAFSAARSRILILPLAETDRQAPVFSLGSVSSAHVISCVQRIGTSSSEDITAFEELSIPQHVFGECVCEWLQSESVESREGLLLSRRHAIGVSQSTTLQDLPPYEGRLRKKRPAHASMGGALYIEDPF